MNGSIALTRYDRVAIALHWAMALMILAMLPMGFLMEGVEPVSLRISVYQFHKSLGFAILLLALVRLAWRIAHPAPALPASMKAWERCAAELAHGLIYAFMVVMPLTGWLLISTSSNRFPTHFFGTFRVPLLDWFGEDRKQAHMLFESMHYWLAIGAVGLLALHVAAALKHHLFARDSVLLRMLPRCLGAGLERRSHA